MVQTTEIPNPDLPLVYFTTGDLGGRVHTFKPEPSAEGLLRNAQKYLYNKVPKSTLDAAGLHALGSNLDDEVALSTIHRSLALYASQLDSPGSGDWDYTLGLMTDMPIVAEAAPATRVNKNHSDGTVYGNTLHTYLTQDARVPGQIPKEYWMFDADLVDLEEASKLLHKVNIETFDIEACHALTLLQEKDKLKLTDTYLMQKIYDIEAFYAPICEIIGNDILAADLRSECNLIRLKRAGLDEYIEKADTMLSQFDEDDFGYALMSMEDLLDVSDRPHTPFIDSGATSEGKTTVDGTKIEYRTIARKKTRGSTAMKLFRKTKQEKEDRDDIPKDLFAGTVVVNKKDDVIDLFASMVERLQKLEANNSAIDLAYQIRGNSGNVRLHRDQLSLLNGFEVSEDDPAQEWTIDDSGFEVAKVTYKVRLGDKDIPVEIQVQTERERRIGRIGRASHLLYKNKRQNEGKNGVLGEYGESARKQITRALGEINTRAKDLLKNPTLTPSSAERADKLALGISAAQKRMGQTATKDFRDN